MDFSRITRTHVWIVGAVVILISCGIIFGVFIMNMMQTQAIAAAYQLAVDTKAATRPVVTTSTKKAQDDLAADQALHVQFLIRNPQFHVDMGPTPAAREERMDALRQLELELRGDRGNDGRLKLMLERAFNRRSPGLTAVAHFDAIPPPQPAPSQAFKTSPMVFPAAGTVDVQGTYAAIERYFDSLSRLPRICTLGAVALDSNKASSATSVAQQNMVHATFAVTAYLFLQGLPEAATGGGGPAAGGPGGMGGGYPAAPGGGNGYPAAAPKPTPPPPGK